MEIGNHSAVYCYTSKHAPQTCTGYFAWIQRIKTPSKVASPLQVIRCQGDDMGLSKSIVLRTTVLRFRPPRLGILRPLLASLVSTGTLLRKRRSRHSRGSISRVPTQAPLAVHGRLRAAAIRSPSRQANKRSVCIRSIQSHVDIVPVSIRYLSMRYHTLPDCQALDCSLHKPFA
jgi:hypothetical protein